MNVELLRTISILIIYLSPIYAIIAYLYCLRIYYSKFPEDKPQKIDIEWNHKFKVNEYYNQFGNNLKSIINA